MANIFGLEELKAIKGIIQVASERGTFNVEEFGNVGKVYNQLTTFIQAADEAIVAEQNRIADQNANVTTQE